MNAVSIRVRYAETDQMGIAHHAEYFAWFEVGRTELLRSHGLTYRDLEERGVRFPVIGTEARFLRPAHYDDVLEVRTTVASMTGARIAFAYEIHREGTGGPIATARTEHAAVDAEGRPQRMPADVRARLGVKVVVTGAAGFIGSHLTESLLADGREVVGVDAFVDYYPREIKERNLARARDHRSFRLVEGSLQDMELASLVEGASQVFHLAAQAGVRASWGEDFAVYTDNNVLATQRLLEAAVAARVPRLVNASSSSVYGDSAALPLQEGSICRPVSPYGVTKLAAEHLANLYHSNMGVPVVSLRYFTVYGPRQRPDMAFHRFLRAAREGSPIRVFGDGKQTRDFTFVDDIVVATRAAADSGKPGSVYNVGGGERVALSDVIARIEKVTGRRLEVTREGAQKGDMRDTFADTSAARRDLGFRSTVGLDEGLAREWEWIRGQA